MPASDAGLKRSVIRTMEITGTTKVCGLIGSPVAHTLSPLIQNTLAEDLGQNLVYVPLPVAEDPGAAVRGCYAMGFTGMNVTVPYKQAVIPFLTELDPFAGRIGAVNTLVRTEDQKGYKGYNTDVLGLRRALLREHCDLRGRSVVLTGAGGAARAAGFCIADAGAENLVILNRTEEKAALLASEIGAAFPQVHVTSGFIADAGKHGKLPAGRIIAIQSTSVGLSPDTDKTPIEDPAFFEKVEFAFDLIYKPAETRFLACVREAGGRTANGLKMLLWQGIASFELWTGTEVSDEEAARIEALLTGRQTAEN
jgi:shikimate dehydrogenase